MHTANQQLGLATLKQAQAIKLIALDKAVQRLLKATRLLVTPKDDHTVAINHSNPWYLVLKHYKEIDFQVINTCFEEPNIPPYCRLLFRSDLSVELHHFLQSTALVIKPMSLHINWQTVNQLKALLYRLRQQRLTPCFRAKLRTYQRQEEDNFRSYSGYVRTLFQKYSRLLVVRVDLGYYKKFTVTYQQFCQDFDQFIQLVPCNPAFRDKVGYMWKMEYGVQKQFHVHLLLFYDGAKRREDGSIAKMIGQLWERITPSRGIYYNCNTPDHKKRLDYQGINCLGMIERKDELKVNHLITKVVRYLVKIDPYLKLIKTDNRKLTDRGQMPID